MLAGPGDAIRLVDVYREFPGNVERRTLYRVLRGIMTGIRSPHTPRIALRHVNLVAARGDKIAVIGNNGAGKSTLLRIVAGLLRPTSGTVSVRGEMALLTALGAGMIEELSVLDNTMLYGALYGVEPAAMRAQLPDILQWADLGSQEHAILRTLSSGTRARLAFSVVRHLDADILLIDEALSAGDITFRAKCRAFFDEPRNRDRTFLVATHDMEFARSFCSRAIWLDAGDVRAAGPSGTVVSQYVAAQSVSPRRTATVAH